MIGGVALNREGGFQALPAADNETALSNAQQVGILGDIMSGSQSVIHALNKLSSSIGDSNDLGFSGDTTTGSPSVDLSTQSFSIAGTSNEIETSAADQTLTIGLPNDVTIGGTLTATTAVVPAAAGGATLGSAAAEFGGLFLGDDDDISFGADQDYKLKFRSSDGAMVFQNAIDDAGFSMFMMADAGADAGDEYSMNVANGGVFTLKHDAASAGTQAATLTITPGASAAADVAAFSGIVRVGSNVIQASDGGTTITMDINDNVTIGNDLTTNGDLTVSGNDITFGNGATIGNGDANTLTITEATIALAGDVLVGGDSLDVSSAADFNLLQAVGLMMLRLVPPQAQRSSSLVTVLCLGFAWDKPLL